MSPLDSKAQTILGKYHYYTRNFKAAEIYFQSALKAAGDIIGIWNINALFTTEAFSDFQIDTGKFLRLSIHVFHVYNEVVL